MPKPKLPAAPAAPAQPLAPEQVKAIPAHGLVRVTIRKVDPILGQPDGVPGLIGELQFIDQFGRTVTTKFPPESTDTNRLFEQAFTGGITVSKPDPAVVAAPAPPGKPLRIKK